MAPDAKGLLWNKRTFASDLAVAFNIEENSEWFGWGSNPTHRHNPADHIQFVLTDTPASGLQKGYRLEVNARDRTATVLYRNDQEVALVRQDYRFPIQFHGGHAPYSPRKSRLVLIKRGGLLRVVVNGKEVLCYEDPTPLPVSHVALGGYRTRVNISHIEIRNLEVGDEGAPRPFAGGSQRIPEEPQRP